jgi:hypothetical protein
VVEVGLMPAGGEKPGASVLLPGADPRRWGPEAGAIQLAGELRVPANFPPGPGTLALRLRDPSARLCEDGRFAIRLANEDVTFLPANGWNILAGDL